MSIGEVLAIDETTAPIMMEYGMHCMVCPVSQMETLEMGCAVHGMNADEREDVSVWFSGKGGSGSEQDTKTCGN